MLTIESGTRIGNYILKEKIGAGTFGEVWKAHHHERPGQWVAVKIAAEEHCRQLRREGRFPHIQHPNVVPIIDSDTRGEVPYVVMPLLAGNLADLIAQHGGGLPEDQVEALLRDILTGLAAIQAGGIEAHRDVKPSNILLDAKGRAVVSDFGLSLVAPGMEQSQSVSRSQSVMQSGDKQTQIVGTPAYMDPEAQEGREAAADVYAVGAVLFEMLVGRRPVGQEVPSRRRKDLRRPAFWDDLFSRSYCSLAERYPNAAAMLEDVNRGPKPVPPILPPRPDPPDPPPPELPPPAPLPDELWEALAVRWEERERLPRLLAEHCSKITEALTIYAETHRHVQALRQQEAQIVGEQQAAEQRLTEVCGKIVAQLEKETAPLEQARDNLLAEGCLPNHPEVQKRDRRIEPYKTLRGRVERLPAADGSHPLVPCLVAMSKLLPGDPRLTEWTERLKTLGIPCWVSEIERTLAAKDGLGAHFALTYLQRLIPSDSRISSWRLQVAILSLPDPLVLDLGGGVTMELVPIPAGEFMMGSPEGEKGRDGDEGPRHKVRIGKPFYMGKHQVTQKQWRAVMGKEPSYFKGDDLPVEQVLWEECREFCRKLSAKARRQVRLPSEAEWEYACRAGTTTPFHFGATISTDQANYDGNYTYGNGRKGQYREKTTPVGSFPTNAFGLHDMHGNVWEWCEDVWHGNYEGAPTDGSAWTTGGDQPTRVLRGGSWRYDPLDCRAANRVRNRAAYRGDNIGLRVAMDF